MKKKLIYSIIIMNLGLVVVLYWIVVYWKKLLSLCLLIHVDGFGQNIKKLKHYAVILEYSVSDADIWTDVKCKFSGIALSLWEEEHEKAESRLHSSLW